MKKDYHAISQQELTEIFEALKNNNKCEQYNFEVKTSGNSIEVGQICGMLNSEGGLIIVGIEEKTPKGSGYVLHQIQDLQAENGKIITQIDKLKRDNSDVANIIETCCIVEPFTYDGRAYPIIKINPSDTFFVFDGRIYYRQREDKGYFKTRKEIVTCMGKAGDYAAFVHKIESFKAKLSKIKNCLKTRDTAKIVYLPSSEIDGIKNLIGTRASYVKIRVDITKLTENLTDLCSAVQYIEESTKRGDVIGISFSSLEAPFLDTFIERSDGDATTVLSEIIGDLEKISAA